MGKRGAEIKTFFFSHSTKLKSKTDIDQNRIKQNCCTGIKYNPLGLETMQKSLRKNRLTGNEQIAQIRSFSKLKLVFKNNKFNL